ncbi:MAG: hypothetical protein HQ536_02455, partial [Parcubacteria group bacterium]|nr:hypothetical protein [Parcubacteria group bacterium]
MQNLLKNNAYHILGLDITSSQKDILKRSKEIIKRLQIDDFPEYALDINMFDDFRTESTAREAVQKLQSPKKKIKEYFFWLQIIDEVDAEALELIKLKDYKKALKTWESASRGESLKACLYK